MKLNKETIKNAGAWMIDNAMVPIKESEKHNSLLYTVYGKKLNPKIAAGGLAIYAGVKVSDLKDMGDKITYGRIEAGYLSNMTSSVLSPAMHAFQNGQLDESSIMMTRAIKENNATGDLVFALHNMR